MDSVRQNKISRLLQKELAVYFQQHGREFSGGGLVTVTVVRVSPDLGVAKVYVSILAPKDRQQVLNSIRERASGIRREIGMKVGKQLRRVPELIFYLDDSLDKTERIEELLKK